MKFFNTLMILATISFVSFAQIPTDSLVAYYPFTGNANDLSGKGNNGTVTGATLTTDRGGNVNSAYSFSSVGDFIKIPSSPTIDAIGTSITLSANIFCTALPISSGYIIDKYSNKYNLCILSNGRIRFSVGGSGILETNNAIPLNVWHHIVGVYDTTAFAIYVDGQLVKSSVPLKTGPITSGGDLFIGCYQNCSASYGFKGKIDDIRIYSRTLIQAEVTALFNEVPPVPNNPPGFISTPDTLATEDLAWSYAITAVDVDAGDVVTYSLRTPPQGMTLSGNTVSWTPTNAQVGSNIIIIRATDSHGAFSDQTFRVRVANVNDAPVITSLAPTAAVQGQLFQYQAQASDPDVGDVLTWQLTTKPTGMTISSSGLVSWTPTQEQIGNNAVVISVNDVANVTAQQSFTIVVTNVNDAPVITNPANQNATEDIPFSLQLTATDPDANQVFWFVVSGPDSLKVNLNTGLVAWTPKQNVAGTTVTVKIRATDAVLSDTTTFTISVAAVNDPPVITSILPTQFKTDTLYSIPLIATDEEGDPVTWSIIRKPATMSIIANNLVWAPTVTGIDTITIVASDGTGFDTLSQAVQVQNASSIKFHSRAALPSTFELKSIRNATGTISVIAGLPKSANFGSISLFSVSGKKIAEKNISGSGWHSVNFGSMPRGSYLMRMNAGGKSFVERVVN